MPHSVETDRAVDPRLTCLAMLARFHGQPDHLNHQQGASVRFDSRDIAPSAKSLGLKSRTLRSSGKRLADTPLPALARHTDGHCFILARADENQAFKLEDGVVQQLQIITLGGVVTPGQELMLIVPDEETLEAEALLENKDIGLMEEGQRAEVKIYAFPFPKYGPIEGTLTDIANNAIVDEERGPGLQNPGRPQSIGHA